MLCSSIRQRKFIFNSIHLTLLTVYIIIKVKVKDVIKHLAEHQRNVCHNEIDFNESKYKEQFFTYHLMFNEHLQNIIKDFFIRK